MTARKSEKGVSMEEHDVLRQPEQQPGLMLLENLKARMRFVRELKDCMEEGLHYGRIPGIAKPSLWKPGAEVLCAGFQLIPRYEEHFDDLPGNHLRVRVKCSLFHVVTGRQEGESIAICSSLESKYRYRQQERVCPKCGKTAIIKGKADYGGGFLCFAKKGGCGAKFADADKSIVDQVVGQIDNPDVADVWNTIAQMATKRSFVAATLIATAASEFFTQDDDSDHRPSESAPAEEKRLEVKPKQEEKPAVSPAQSQPKGKLKEIRGTIVGIQRGQKSTCVKVHADGSEEEGEITDFYFRDPPPIGMPAMKVGGHWEHLSGLKCKIAYESVESASGRIVHMLREIHVDLPVETKPFREKMQEKYPGPGLLSANQKQALVQESRNSSVTDADFDAFLHANYQHTIDTLPADQYANVREHLVSGFVTEWCFDNGPTAPVQASA